MNHVTSFEQVNEGLEIIARHRKDAQLVVTQNDEGLAKGEIIVSFKVPRMHPTVRGALRRRGWVDYQWIQDGDLVICWRWRE